MLRAATNAAEGSVVAALLWHRECDGDSAEAIVIPEEVYFSWNMVHSGGVCIHTAN
jgi:hypothetical protein